MFDSQLVIVRHEMTTHSWLKYRCMQEKVRSSKCTMLGKVYRKGSCRRSVEINYKSNATGKEAEHWGGRSHEAVIPPHARESEVSKVNIHNIPCCIIFNHRQRLCAPYSWCTQRSCCEVLQNVFIFLLLVHILDRTSRSCCRLANMLNLCQEIIQCSFTSQWTN